MEKAWYHSERLGSGDHSKYQQPTPSPDIYRGGLPLDAPRS